MPRVIKKYSAKFTSISNGIFYDSEISFKAKGILSYMISRPDDWVFYEKEIAKNGVDGVKSIRAGIKELIGRGYIKRHQVRRVKGHYDSYEYWIYDTPGPHEDEEVFSQDATGIEDPFFDDCELPTREHTQYDTNRLFRDQVDMVTGSG